jgi:hypothetical protein
MELPRVLQLGGWLRRAGGMVQPEHFYSSNSFPAFDQLPSITRRSRRSLFAGSRLTPSISAPLLYVAATRSVPCANTQRDNACWHAELRIGDRSVFKIDVQPGRRTRYWKSPAATGSAYEWSYGIVYSPKWLKGLTVSADWWHIDLRSLISSLGAQFIVEADLPGLVFRTPPPPGTPPLSNGQPDRGALALVIDPNDNLSGAIFEGLDYEAIYLLDSGIFGHGDFGRLTFTVNGTWLPGLSSKLTPTPNDLVSPVNSYSRDSPWPVHCHGIGPISVCFTTARLIHGCKVSTLVRWSTGLANMRTTMFFWQDRRS